MSMKTLMMTTAATLAMSGAAYAETDVSADLDAGVSGETMVEAADSSADMETTFDTEATVSAEADADAEGEAVDGDTLIAEVDGSSNVNAEAGVAFEGMAVADIVGLDVWSADGEAVGEIDYVIMVDNQYEAVIGIGGFLGLGEYTVALPLENFAMMDGALKLDAATEAELEAMPEIDESELEALDGSHVIS